MTSKAKKYTLFSSSTMAEKGGKPPCAFFASAAGCRNGDNCKFSHEPPSASDSAGADASVPQQRPRSTSSGSVVSSESDGSSVAAAAAAAQAAAAVEKKKSAKKKKEIDDSPFVTASETSTTSNNTDNAANNDGHAAKEESEKKKKKKNRRGKRSPDEDDLPFANPKNKKAKTVSSSTAPSSSSSSAAAANLPPPSTSSGSGKAKTAPTTTAEAPSSPQTSPQPKKERKVSVRSSVVDFRKLKLPVAPFPGQSSASADAAAATQSKKSPTTPKETPKEETTKKQQPKNTAVSSPALPLPTSNPTARKWLELVKKTREHPRYPLCYDFDKFHNQDRFVGGKTAWVKSRPAAGEWCKDLPPAIGIDCEMCETEDPVSGERNHRELCRISVIDAGDNSVLLDTLVKPSWPVVDYRTWVNGIAAPHLESVQFTIRHAQAFMMALCNEETIILGHAVHNDLAAIRMEHHCVVDSACLYKSAFAPTATVSLRDTAAAVMQKKMPDTHDSVNDARTALAVLEHYREKKGDVDLIPRRNMPGSSSSSVQTTRFSQKLFIHRIPKKLCTETHLSQLFIVHCSVEPEEVDPIEFSGGMGKTYVTFRSPRHAELAFDSLDGKAEQDASKRLQKKVFLRNGSYIRVRKMAYEKEES